MDSRETGDDRAIRGCKADREATLGLDLLVGPRTSRRVERVKLQVEVLLGGGDAGMPDFHGTFSYNYLKLISKGHFLCG